jgi:NAD dependent epimerase/dehydratase
MKALVTGAGGFIGSHLVELLIEKGYDVKAFVRYNSKNSWGFLEDSRYKKNIEVISGDIRDFDSVSSAIHDVDTVFHLAALIGIPYSYTSPMAYIKTNIEGTYNVLESCKRKNIKNVLITSTSETYGSAQYVPIDEKHPNVGQSPYSATKIGADQIARSYYMSFGTPVKIVRPFNTFGPRQSSRAIIPTIISQFLSGKKTIHLGSLTPTRDFTFVKDTVAGFLAIAESTQTLGEATNIGMNQEITIGELVNTISQILGIKIEVTTDDHRLRPEASEVVRLRCDNTKIQKITNWRPRYTFNQGLEETISWMKQNIHLYKPEIYNV